MWEAGLPAITVVQQHVYQLTHRHPGKGLAHGCLRARGQVPEVDRLYDYLLGYLRCELLTQV